MLFFILIVLALLVVIALYERTTDLYKIATKLNGPGFLLPIIGNSFVLFAYTATSGFKEFRRNTQRFRSGYYYYYFGTLFVQVQTAEAFELILTSQNTKKGLFYRFLEPYIGTGVLSSFGSKWFERRRLISPSFHFKILNRFLQTFKDHTDKMIESLASRLNERVNVKTMFSNYSMGLICETSMGIPVKDASHYEEALNEYGAFCQRRIFSPHIHNDKMYRWLGWDKEAIQLAKPMQDFSKDLIKKRRTILESQNWQQAKQDNDDSDEETSNVYFKKNQSSLLDALLLAQKQTGIIDDAGIQEEVDTFVFTGHDTITAAMTYTILCIGEFPEVQQKIYDEIQSIVKDENVSPKHLASCTYLDMVIKESLRLLPPVPIILRTLEEDLNFNGIILPRGVNYNLNIFDLHRDPKWFPDPEKFIPERFLPENTANRHHFAYLPFSAGLRNCIGQKYAMMQMKTMIIKLMQTYRIEAVTKIKDLEFIAVMILHTHHPIEVKFYRRNTVVAK